MDVFDKLLAIFYSVILLIHAIYLRKAVGSWLFPGSLFSLFWFFFTFIPLVALFEVPINSSAVGFITCSVILFSQSFMVFKWDDAFLSNQNKADPSKIYDTPFLGLVLFTSIAISVLSSFLHVMVQGFSFSEIFTSPIRVASQFANARYNDGLIPTVFGPVSLVFSNIAIVIGGLIFGASQSRSNRKILFAFLPSVIILLTQSSKGLFFLSFFLFLGGIMVNKVYASKFTLFNAKLLRQSFIIGAIFIILIGISFLSRGVEDTDGSYEIFSKLRFLFATYFFGHLYSFADWFTVYSGQPGTGIHYDTSDYYMGFYTFMSFFRMAGSTKVVPFGTYDEFYQYKDLLDSNIYTVFRGLIMDFGILGSLVFMILNGIFIHFIYYLFLRTNRPVFTALCLVFIVGYFYMSFMLSMLTWVIIPFTFLVCYLVLRFNDYRFVFNRSIKKK